MIPTALRLARRCVLAPLLVALCLALTILGPLILALAGLASLFDGRRRPLRVGWIFLNYVARDAAATVACFALWIASGFARRADRPAVQDRYYAVVGWFLDGLYRAGERAIDFELRLEESGAAERVLSECRRPVLVLSRHADAGDSFLLVHRLLCRYRRAPRVVMKAGLQLDPLIDAFGNRLPNCFVRGGGSQFEQRIGVLARDLPPRAAVVIFPEGGNVSPERRRRGVVRLLRAGHRRHAAEALRMHHLSAPRPGGTTAAIDAAPEADVVFVAHEGMPEATTLRGLWSELPLGRPARMRMWHVSAEDVPRTEEEQIDWLFGWWKELDVWLARQQL